MTTARHFIALLNSHLQGDDEQLFSVALQAAAHQARLGHIKVASELKSIVDQARSRPRERSRSSLRPTLLAQPRGELASLLAATYPNIPLSHMVVSDDFREKILRLILEQHQYGLLSTYGLSPKRKILLVGPPGAGKTMTANVLASELKVPLFTVLFETLITRYMGETAAKLRQIFDIMQDKKGVYFFDEFDAIGASRESGDVGEMRRVLNSFLQFLEQDKSSSLIIAATNHPEILDRALFRRFDEIITFHLPTDRIAFDILQAHLSLFDLSQIEWRKVLEYASGLSQAELVKVANEAAKNAIFSDTRKINTKQLIKTFKECKTAHSFSSK